MKGVLTFEGVPARYLWTIFSLNIINTGMGLFILAGGLIFAIYHPDPWLVVYSQQLNPANPGSLPGRLIWSYVALFVLTGVGAALLYFKVFKECKRPVDPFSLTSVVQGFVYGTAGIAIGLLSL